MKKISKRNMYEALINWANGDDLAFTSQDENGNATLYVVTNDDLMNFAENEIALLDKKATKAKETAAKKKAESDVLTNLVAAALTDEFEPVCDIAIRVNADDPDATVGKISYRLRSLIESGLAEKEQITIEDEDGKKKKVMGYRTLVVVE